MAAAESFANDATTTVSSGGTGNPPPPALTQEAWIVASSASFPAASTGVTQFHVADPAAPTEIIAVTNISGVTWTVTRGAESTTPVAHSPGFTIVQLITAGFLNAVIPLPTASSGGILYGNGVPVPAWLAGDVSGTRKFLTSEGNAGTATAPAWGTLTGTDLPATNILNFEDVPSDVLRGSVQSIAGDIWILVNATYNTGDQNFYRIDASKPSFGYQIQGQNNIYGEPVPGANMWVAQPEAYTLIRGGGSRRGLSIRRSAGGSWGSRSRRSGR